MLGEPNRFTNRARMMAVVCALSTIALLSALAAPSMAAVATTSAPVELSTQPMEQDHAGAGAVGDADAGADEAGAGDGDAQLCVRISTNPPAVGVYEDCGSGGSGVEIDGRQIP